MEVASPFLVFEVTHQTIFRVGVKMMISTHRAVVFSHSSIEILSCLNFAFKMYPDHLVESVLGPLISFDLLVN